MGVPSTEHFALGILEGEGVACDPQHWKEEASLYLLLTSRAFYHTTCQVVCV